MLTFYFCCAAAPGTGFTYGQRRWGSSTSGRSTAKAGASKTVDPEAFGAAGFEIDPEGGGGVGASGQVR